MDLLEGRRAQRLPRRTWANGIHAAPGCGKVSRDEAAAFISQLQDAESDGSGPVAEASLRQNAQEQATRCPPSCSPPSSVDAAGLRPSPSRRPGGAALPPAKGKRVTWNSARTCAGRCGPHGRPAARLRHQGHRSGSAGWDPGERDTLIFTPGCGRSPTRLMARASGSAPGPYTPNSPRRTSATSPSVAIAFNATFIGTSRLPSPFAVCGDVGQRPVHCGLVVPRRAPTSCGRSAAAGASRRSGRPRCARPRRR